MSKTMRLTEADPSGNKLIAIKASTLRELLENSTIPAYLCEMIIDDAVRQLTVCEHQYGEIELLQTDSCDLEVRFCVHCGIWIYVNESDERGYRNDTTGV